MGWDNDEHFFTLEKRWDSTTVESALRSSLKPDTLWGKEELLVCEGAFPYNDRNNLWMSWNTPLHLSIRARDYDASKVILQHGANINILNSRGHTVLHEAILRRNMDDIEFLLQLGADPNQPSKDGYVALHLALNQGNEEMFFHLVRNGAALQAATHFRWSILDLALLASERGILSRLMSTERALLPSPMLSCYKELNDARACSEKLQDTAGELLATVLSNQILPPQHLYETYLATLQSLNIQDRKVWTPDAVGDLTEAFTSVLHKLSKVPRLSSAESFCNSCAAFQQDAARSWRGTLNEYGRGSGSFQIHNNRTELENCADAGCPLCALVADWLYEKPNGQASYVPTIDDDGKVAWRDIKDGSFPDPDRSPITLQVSATLMVPLPEYPSRVSSIDARLADSKGLPVTFSLEGFDIGFGQATARNHYGRNESTGSPCAMAVAKQWLRNCRTSPAHARCREAFFPGGSPALLPKRVLHVGSDRQDPRLFESHGLKASYCILSYCWGRPGNSITTTQNIAKRLDSIPLISLPALLSDAILTARELGFEYIWVDALCIIQDSEDDWACEASKMLEYYSQADLTITSLFADDSRDHLFQPRPRRVCRPIPLHLGATLPKWDRPDLKEGSTTQLAVYPPREMMRQVNLKGPVHQRAWILQEHAISTRLLYFGAGLLHWECLHSYLLEPYPSLDGETPNIDTALFQIRDQKLVMKGFPPQFPTSSGYRNNSPMGVWQTQVEDYTARNMTKPSDRIPAFLGIAKAIEKILKDDFVGGIWRGEDHLLESLCWSLISPDTGERNGPTWTWASRSGKISYRHLRQEGEKTRKAAVISCDAVADLAQRNISGSITLRGTLALLQSDSPHMRNQNWNVDQVSMLPGCYYAFDIVSFAKAPQRIIHPKDHSCHFPRWEEKRGTVRLLLQSIDSGLEQDMETVTHFHRIGIGFFRSDYFDKIHYTREKLPVQPLIKQSMDKAIRAVQSGDSPSSSRDDQQWTNVGTGWQREVRKVQTDRIITIW